MKALAATCFALLLGCVAACANRGAAEANGRVNSRETTLIGRVLLPGNFDRRGLEVHSTVIADDGERHDEWLLFDENGQFTHVFEGRLTSVTVTAGVSSEVYRIEGDALPAKSAAGQLNMGAIELRDRLKRHRQVVRDAGGKSPGEVRVAMWFGKPPVGPSGESVALGSRQFPEVKMGFAQEWLVPLGTHTIYFLVERPADEGRGAEWRGGRQRLFGPFNSAELPTELLMD